MGTFSLVMEALRVFERVTARLGKSGKADKLLLGGGNGDDDGGVDLDLDVFTSFFFLVFFLLLDSFDFIFDVEEELWVQCEVKILQETKGRRSRFGFPSRCLGLLFLLDLLSYWRVCSRCLLCFGYSKRWRSNADGLQLSLQHLGSVCVTAFQGVGEVEQAELDEILLVSIKVVSLCLSRTRLAIGTKEVIDDDLDNLGRVLVLGLDANAFAIHEDVPLACPFVDMNPGWSRFLLLFLSLLRWHCVYTITSSYLKVQEVDDGAALGKDVGVDGCIRILFRWCLRRFCDLRLGLSFFFS